MGYLNTLNIGGTDYAISDGGLYGTCDSLAATTPKVVTCANFDELVEGVTVRVKFKNTNTVATNCQLKVNNTAAKPILSTISGSAYTGGGFWVAGEVVSFTYDGTNWCMNDCYYKDTQNTAGSTNSTNKLFLIGATGQSSAPQTYSNSKVYATDGALVADTFNGVYLGSATSGASIGGFDYRMTVPPGVDYVLGAACEAGVDTSISSTTSTNLPTSAAVAAYVNSAIGDMSGALVYKGTASTAAAISGTSYKKGWYWIAADTFALTSSINVEPGDMIIAKQDKTSTFANDIDVVQTNIDTLTTTEIDNLWAAA